MPHEVPVCEAYFSHVPPLAQQPVGHVVASHEQVPLVVSHSPLEHAEHVAPAVPHDAADCDPQDSHVPFGPPLQHPLGQEFASQTHFPLLVLHSSPAAHPAQEKIKAVSESAAFVCVGERCSLPVTDAAQIAGAVAAMRK